MLKYLFGLLAIVGLSSCGNVEEEIYIAKNGSGSYEVKTNIIPATVNMSMTFAKMFAAMDTTKELDLDSLEAVVLETVWADFGEGEIDSVLDIKSEMPDSLKMDPEYMAFVDRLEVFMRGSKAKGYINMGMEFDFKNGTDFEMMMNKFEEFQARNGDANEGTPFGELGDVRSTVTIESDEMHFVRKTEYLNPLEDESELESLKEMIGKGTYTSHVITKRKIKEVKSEHIKSVGDYEVYFEYDFLAAAMGMLNTDFEIIFEEE